MQFDENIDWLKYKWFIRSVHEDCMEEKKCTDRICNVEEPDESFCFFAYQGHPVNPRDYCGWTPLHEACNHGHYGKSCQSLWKTAPAPSLIFLCSSCRYRGSALGARR